MQCNEGWAYVVVCLCLPSRQWFSHTIVDTEWPPLQTVSCFLAGLWQTVWQSISFVGNFKTLADLYADLILHGG